MYGEHLRQKWLMGQLLLRRVSSPGSCKAPFVQQYIHLNTCRHERGQTCNNDFSSLTLVKDGLTPQRVPLRENNQILWTTNHHLKSCLWFPYEPSKCPRNPMSVHKLHLPAFFSHGKCHNEKILYPTWDLVNGATTPHFTLKAEVALSRPVEFQEAPVEGVRDTSLFGPKENTTESILHPWSLEGSLSVAASTSLIFYQQMSFSFCHCQQI